ncbi:MAG: RyR domain-containing protein [Baekduia sp.]
MNPKQIARVCHEANRAWCEANGDTSQKPWDEADQWQRDSAIEGVTVALDGATPAELHQAWCEAKTRDGWIYGEVKDAEAKTHPCLVAYADLPPEQRVKDVLFSAIVGALR